jgi:GNAT superfamily N-acetyltransferase
MEDLISIRKASAEDSEGILACLHAAFAPYESRYTPAAYEDTVLTPQSLQKRLQTMSVLVAHSGGSVIGTITCAVSGDEGHLRGMAVRPDWQGKNVAHLLLEAAERELRDKRCRRVTLDTTAPLERAMHFYEKYGYRKSGRVSDFFGMPLHEYVKTLT